MGRSEDLRNLHEFLQQSDRVAIVAAIGMGGIGKTELALQYVYQHQHDYPGGIWWLEGQERVAQILKYAARMGLREAPTTLPTDMDQVQWYYDRWLEAIPEGLRLIVFDDLVDYDTVRSLFPQEEQFRVLLTTRSQLQQQQKQVKPLVLGALPPSQADELVYQIMQLHRAPQDIDPRLLQEQTAIEQICQFLDYLPLGIEVVASYLRLEPDLSIEQKLQKLQAERLKNEALSPVEAAFESSWEKLNPTERQLAELLGVFAAAPIAWKWVEDAVNTCRIPPAKPGLWQRLLGKPAEPQQWCLLLDQEALQRARRRLVELSLLSRVEEKQYLLHALMREFFAAKLAGAPTTLAESLRRAMATAMTKEAKTVKQTVTLADLERMQAAIPHLVCVAQGLSDLIEDSTDSTWSFIALARLAKGQSRWQEAEQWYVMGRDKTQARFGANHPDVATSLNNLAELYKAQGRYEEAEPRYLRALAISEQQLGANHPDVATRLNNLANLYDAQGRYEEAEPLYLRALAIGEQQLGANHPDVATSLNNLANLYDAQGRYEEAEPRYLRALAISEQQLGANHPDVATRLNNLANLYQAQGRYEEAEPRYLRALEIGEQQLGANHPDVATRLNNLASLYQAQGRYEEAEPLYLRALNIWVNTLLENHPNIEAVFNNFVEMLQAAIDGQQTGQLSDNPLTQELLQRLQAQSGGDEPGK